jgi:hypothetical protein
VAADNEKPKKLTLKEMRKLMKEEAEIYAKQEDDWEDSLANGAKEGHRRLNAKKAAQSKTNGKKLDPQ